MPSLGDSAVIIVIGLLLFGPKGLAQIARQLGKLMGEFRRASNEFRMQMEEELRVSEQTERQKEIAAIEAAAPVTPAIPATTLDPFGEDHPHMRSVPADTVTEPAAETAALPIASSGELSIMPPATGLPEPRGSSLASFVESVPHVDAGSNGHDAKEILGAEQKPNRYTQHHEEGAVTPVDASHSATTEESLHG